MEVFSGVRQHIHEESIDRFKSSNSLMANSITGVRIACSILNCARCRRVQNRSFIVFDKPTEFMIQWACGIILTTTRSVRR